MSIAESCLWPGNWTGIVSCLWVGLGVSNPGFESFEFLSRHARTCGDRWYVCLPIMFQFHYSSHIWSVRPFRSLQSNRDSYFLWKLYTWHVFVMLDPHSSLIRKKYWNPIQIPKIQKCPPVFTLRIWQFVKTTEKASDNVQTNGVCYFVLNCRCLECGSVLWPIMP